MYDVYRVLNIPQGNLFLSWSITISPATIQTKRKPTKAFKKMQRVGRLLNVDESTSVLNNDKRCRLSDFLNYDS